MADAEPVRGLRPVDRLEVLVIVDNATDNLSSLPDIVQHEREFLQLKGMSTLAGECLCCAAWGLSLLLVMHVGERKRTLLFDARPESYAFERNGDRLELPYSEFEAVVLSHGHFDHAAGLVSAMRLISEAKDGEATPLHLHPGMFERRGLKFPDGFVLPMKDVPTAAELEAHGAEARVSDEPALLLGETVWLSGEIPRLTDYEVGLVNQVRQREDGEWEPDPWIMDECFVAVEVRDKGLIVFTACSHAGVVNVMTEARARFPETPMHAVMGGLHLAGAAVEAIVPETVRDLARFDLDWILPGHCTGWRAVNALAQKFGEEVVVPSAVGRLHTF
jgi:7,8-dihydropterin-6-yl-methyl-4-(beta-D-ribofuranosyl)aminobenzene 5'-phosphate synthase